MEKGRAESHQKGRLVALSTGVDLNTVTLGDPSAPAIILLHGFPETHRLWRHQMLALALNHYVIAPDLRGCGESSRPEGIDAYHPDLLTQDIKALIDALDLREVTLIGHDFGGAIAWGAALRYPEHVRRLAAINAPHPLILQRKLIEDREQRRASQFMRLFRETAIDSDLSDEQLGAFFQALFIDHLGAEVTPEERERYFDLWRRPGAMTAMLNWYRAGNLVIPAMDESPERPEWIDGPFPLVSQPTLVVWSLDNPGLRPCLLDGLEKLATDLTITPLRERSHFLPWERPELVSTTLAGWLKKTPLTPFQFPGQS